MTAPIVVGAKLARPRHSNVLCRSRLVDRLVEQVPGHRLAVIAAGPGYGKTTLLASFAEAYPPGTIWYSLGPEDADLTVFLYHLAAALGAHSRRFGRSLRDYLAEKEITPAAAAGAFSNDLARIRAPIAIILDDYHHVGHSLPLVRFMSSVLEHVGTPVRFVLASRVLPPLPLAKLRVRRELLELGSEDLAFTRDELRTLLESAYARPPSDQALDLVARTTEGWVAAVQLVLAVDPRRSGLEIPGALRRAAQPGSALHDYLAEEVLEQQPEALRRSMLLFAGLDEIVPDIAAAIFPGLDVDTLLNELLSRRLLFVFEGGGGLVYRYHALLLEFLRRRLAAEIPAKEREAFHRRAADEYRRRGDLVAAARQLAVSGNAALLVEFLRDFALRLVDQGHYQALLSWFEGLPAALLDVEPRLRIRLGDVRHYLGDLPGAELEYERALEELRRTGNEEGSAWAILGLARIWNLRGEPERAAREGGTALEIARALSGKDPEGDPEELAIRLLQVVSGAKFYLGQYGEALELLAELEHRCRRDPDRQAAVWNNRAVVWASQGNYQAAARAFEKGLERPGARRSPRAPLHLSNLALLQNEMGDSERARVLFEEALELATRYHNRSQILYCRIGQARLAYRLRDTDRALELLRDVDALNAELKLPLIESDALALRARILAEGGQLAAARSSVSQALAAYGGARRDSNWLLYRIEAAVVELRAGQVQESHQALLELLPLARESEALFPRTLLLYHLGEAQLRLGRPEAQAHLAEAFQLAREMGYDAALRSELSRNFDPSACLLAGGMETEYLARLLAGLGGAAEAPLVPYLRDPSLPAESLRAVLRVLGEIGGPESHRALTAFLAESPGDAANGARAALTQIERRHPELGGRRRDLRGLRLAVLGGLTLSGPQGEIPRTSWRSQRALSIFVYLAVRGGNGVAKDRLVELFWPGEQRRRAEENFHPTLSYVRGALKGHVDGPIVASEDGQYRLDLGVRLTSDVREFEALLAQAHRAKRKGDRLRFLEEALALYRGDFLGDRYESWAEEVRSQLGFRYEEALAETAALYFEAKQIASARRLYARLLERNPFLEEIHQKAMLCSHVEGDRHAVKHQFDRLKQLLRDELGVDPLPETTSLYESLMVSP